MTGTRLEGAAIRERLDAMFEVEFSFRDTAPVAAALAGLPATTQAFILDWSGRVASTQVELGYQFAQLAPQALEVMEPRLVEAWALHAMDAYDRAGLQPALALLKEVDGFLEHQHERSAGALLEEHLGVLLHFLQGLSGRPLQVAEAAHSYTDTDTVYLPRVIARLPEAEANYRLYKATAALLWAQTRFGTFRRTLVEQLCSDAASEARVACYNALETLRLEACIGRELPGLWREMCALSATGGDAALPAPWASLAEQLARPEASAEESLALAWGRAGTLPPFPGRCYQPALRPAAVEPVQRRRMELEQRRFRLELARLLEEQARQRDDGGEHPPLEHRLRPDPEQPGLGDIELTLEDRPLVPPEPLQRLTTSVLLDLGEVPEEYLMPAGPGEYDPSQEHAEREVTGSRWTPEGDFSYDEWDHQRRHYRKQWCAVYEHAVHPGEQAFVAETLQRYGPLVRHLRKTFEAMRDEDRLLKRQSEGDEVDIDALVEALAEARDGREMSERLFTRMHRAERNIAVAFMVDMSGSTKGWINQAEREALLLLGEALETLGDRFAIYGFSGMTRKRCELFRVKSFAEPYNDEVRERIAAIEPKDYTRMGFAVRHLTRLLNEQEARTRILITLSDGKPDDLSDYRGAYGIEDTRRALIEARRTGIRPFCITIDKEGPEYLPHMYGAARYAVVEEVRRLPYKVADIYRKLTT